MSYTFKQNLVATSKYGTKCPYSMTPIGICVHNTANDASAANEIKYMISNTREVSYHVAVDDKEVIQSIPFDRNAWHAGDGGAGAGNRKYIAVEICYSKSGGEKFIEAEKNAAKWIAETLKKYNWTIANVKTHHDFSGKYCPHRTLDMGWDRFLDMVRKELDKLNAPKQNQTTSESLKYAVGTQVTVSSYYTSSTDPISKAKFGTKSGTILKTYPGRNNPYAVGTGGTICFFCNDGDIRSTGKAQEQTAQVQYYPKYTGKSTSLVDALKELGIGSTFSNRRVIATRNGISNYSGAAEQNGKLLGLLKSGKLVK